MMRRIAGLAIALSLTACANTRAQVEPTPQAPPAPAVVKPQPAPEPPRQADQLARIASELVELQNAIAKLMMSARQHDDQLLYVQRRLTELEAQARGRGANAPSLPPSAAMPSPLPPPPIAAPGPAAPLPPAAPSASARASSPSATVTAPSAAPRASAVPPSRPAAPAPSSAGTSSPADELYRDGLAKYQAGDLDGAVVTLYEVVASHPTDPARERAQFLVGEIFLAQKDYRGAVAEFEGLVNAVPGGATVPDALLKLGMAQRSLGDETRARRAWERLVKEYPASPAARQARTLLRARG